MTSPLSLGVHWFTGMVALVAVAVFVAVSVWMAHRRARRAHLAGRVIAIVVAGLGVAGIALRPQRAQPASSGSIVLVTEGAEPSTVDSLRDALHPVTVISPDDTAWQHRRRAGAGRVIGVTGHGMPEYDWAGVTGRVLFRPPPPPEGVTDLVWPRELALGRQLVVRGRLRAADSGWVHLSGPGGVADSAPTIPPLGTFTLLATPRDSGRQVYTLRAVAGAERASAPLGVSVMVPPALRVLVLESRPRFSTRHLKQWLARQGASVVVRTEISRDRYRTEVVNRAGRPAASLGAEFLQTADVVVADLGALDGLSRSERAALAAAIEGDGLGLVIIPETMPRSRTGSATFLSSFAFRRETALEERTAVPRWSGQASEAPAALPVAPWSVAPGPAARPVMWDGTDGVLAAAARRGAGHVVVTLVAESERWVLRGRADAFADYWSHLLAAATDGGPGDRWRVLMDGPILVDRPVPLELLTLAARPAASVTGPDGEDIPLPLVQDTVNAARWRGLLRPRRTGWHVVRAGEGATSWFLVSDPEPWRAWDLSRRRRATGLVGARGAPGGTGDDTSSQPVPLPVAWFWLAALAGATFLWAEGKRLV